MEAANAATSVVGWESNAATEAAATAAAAAASAAAAAGTAEPQHRRPRVAFHVTGFGVFNGVADNPTTHLINELPGQLRDRPRHRAVRYDDCHGRDVRRGGPVEERGGAAAPPLPGFGGHGEGAFEVRSCEVLHVSAEVGGRQVRELHDAASFGSTGRSERAAAVSAPPGPTAATVAAAAAAAAAASAAAAGGFSGSGSGSGSGSSAGVVGPGDGEGGGGASGGTGSGVQGKSADESGGLGDDGGGRVERLGDATDTSADGGGGVFGGGGSKTKGIGKGDSDNDGSDDDDVVEDDDAVTVFVHCGVNGGTDKFALETRGFNEATFRVPDERGHCPSLAPIEPGLPTEHCRVTTVPVADVLERLGALGWGPEHVAESKDAGRFVCNYVYYTSLGLCETTPPAGAGPGPGAAAAGVAAEGGVGASPGASEEGQREEEAKGVFCFSGGGDGGGGGGSEGDCNAAKSRQRRRRQRRRRHSLFIHVPPFEAVPKEKQLALLMACLSTIAAAVSSPTPSPPPPTDDVAAPASPASTAGNGAVPAPPLSLSSYEAAVLAAGPEALSPEPVPSPIADEQNVPAERAAPAAIPSIWDEAESAGNSTMAAAAEEEEEEDEAAGCVGGGGAVGAQRVVQFALAGLADNEDSGHSSGDGSGGGGGGENVYYRGELGGDSESDQAGEDYDGEGQGETSADATRRRLVAAGFDSLDVDAAMATTGSDDTEVNMGFLLDITPLLPRGAPSDVDGLSLRECMNDHDQYGGDGRNGDRGRGAKSTDHARSGSGSSNGGGAIRPRVRPAASSPAGMGGVSPKWIADVSPVRDASPRSGGGGGLLRRLRRGHKRVPSAASAASEATNDGEGERSSEQRALSSSSPAPAPRKRSSFSSLGSPPVQPQQQQQQQQSEYTRRTTGHVARSHSPPPRRGFTGEYGASRREFGSGGCVPKAAAGWGDLAPSGPNLRLALVVRLDLEMAPGTVAAQCSRAALAATRKAEGSGRGDTVAVWRDTGESIVVLGAADAGSLDAVLAVGEASHLPVTMVRDKQAAWVGNVRADTCTVAAIGPAPMSVLRSVAGGLTVL